MAPTLQDFNKPVPTKQLRMEAFQPKRQTSPASNSATINTMATYGAALAPDGALDSTYKSITNQLSYAPSSRTLQTIIGSWDSSNAQGNTDTLRSILIDPDIPDDQKRATIDKFTTEQANSSLYGRVAQAAAMAPSEGENGEQENVRINAAAALDEVDSYNAWVQQNMNAIDSGIDPSFSDNLHGFLESLLPFVDAGNQTYFQQALDGLDGGNAARSMLLLGEGKENMRAALARLPIEQRRIVTTKLMDIIRSTKGSITSNVNEGRAMATLDQMLTPGGYSNTDRWTDNIFSVMDDTILLSPLRKGASLIRGALEGASEARRASEVARRGVVAGQATEAAGTPLQIEFKPTGGNYAQQVDEVIDSLPIDIKRSKEGNLRFETTNAIYNPDVPIDTVIDQIRSSTLGKRRQLTLTEEIDVRQAIDRIRTRKNAIENAPEVTTTFEEVQARSISTRTQPTSVSQIYVNTNPAKARVAHNAIVMDDSGNAARVLAGTTRTDALANDYLPEIGVNGRVRNKVEFDDAGITPDMEILKKQRDSVSNLEAKPVEKAKVNQRVKDDFRNAVGLKARSAMTTIEDATKKSGIEELSSGLRLNVVYGPEDGGFSNAYDGIEAVKASLRKYGVDENNFTILSRQKDGNYGPVNNKVDFKNGDYLIRVKHDFQYSPSDYDYMKFDNAPVYSKVDVAFPGEKGGSGGVVQHVIPKSAVIDQRVFAAGVTAADKSAGLEKTILNKYGTAIKKSWNKLDSKQKQLVDSYIRTANDEGIVFNTAAIKGRGINDDGVELLINWKNVQDTLWTLENTDVNKTLRNKGMMYFEHKGTNTKLLAKPIPRGSVVALKKTFITDEGGAIKILSNQELDELYAKGGTVGELRHPEDFNGETVEYVASRETPDGGYLRAINNDDPTLAYRHGYYHVKYEDPFFITKTDKDGRVTTIARANGLKDARLERDRLNSTQDGNAYEYKRNRDDFNSTFDDELSVQFASGRSTQKLRGERLRKVGEDKTLSDASMESPIESLTRSISSVAHRVNFRDVIETNKRRWMSQFKHLVPTNGAPRFPENLTDIRSSENFGEAANARNSWRYINGLENGYTNLIDDASKAMFTGLADTAGGKGWGWVEKIARSAAKASPSTAARLTAFRLYLASNPVGQLVLQTAPIIPILLARNPLGVVKVAAQYGVLQAFQRGVDLATTMKVGKYAGLNLEEMKDLVRDYELSGIHAAVGAHSYLSDDLARLADKNIGQQVTGAAMTPLRITQKIGFDFGEQTLMDVVWMSERDLMVKKTGRTKLTAEERDLVTAKARAITGDMNKGGEMPYNSNTFSTALQFLQSPHKIAAGLIVGHRGLTVGDRAKLAASYTLIFGVPAVPVVDWAVDKILAQNPDMQLRDTVKGGLTNIVFNKFLSSLLGEESRVDFSGKLQPFTTRPLTDLVGGILSGSVPELIVGGAAPSLFSDGGRISEFFKSVARPFTPGNYDNINDFQQIGLTFLQNFTGISNVMKAMYIMEHKKIVTASGQTVDNDVSFGEALMKAAGFQTEDEVNYWASQKIKWEADDRIDKDVKSIVDDYFTRLTRQGDSVEGVQSYINVMSEAARVFNNNPQYMEKIADYMKFKISQDPESFYKKMFEGAGLYTEDEYLRMINNSGLDQEQVDTLVELKKRAEEAYGS